MSSTDNMKTKLEQIPNSVSGDGKSFVAQLKRFLKGFRDDTNQKIDDIGAGAVEQVFGLKLTEEHEYDSHGNPVNNIFVEFDNTNVSDYLNAQIWMKKSTENAYRMVGTTSNVTYTIPDVLSGATYYVKVVACSTHAGTSDFDTAPSEEITIQGSVLVPDAPTQFYLTFDEEGPLWEWKFTDNGYVDFFELRMDGHAGVWDSNRLDSTRNDFSRVPPPVRSGTAYLFIRNVYGMYSQPATHTFNIVAPSKPAAPTLEFTLDGAVITMAPLPTGCTHYLVEITDFEQHVETFETKNNQFTYFQFSGTIKARYAFVDSNGQGAWSDLVTGNISDGNVDEGRIKANAVTAGKIAANAVTADKIKAGSISSDHISAEKLDATCIKAHSITSDQIQGQSIIGDSIAGSTITAAKIYSGTTESLRIQADNIAAGAIKTAKLDSQAVTADKIKANTITSSQLQVLTTDGHGTIITPGAIATANIQTGAITTAKLEVRSVSGSTVITPGAVATDNIQAGAITAAKIYSGQVQANLIQANNIATNAITTDKLDALAVTAGKVAAGAITAEKLSSRTLSAMFATIGTFQSATQGQPRVVISDSLIEVWDANRVRVKIGLWT